MDVRERKESFKKCGEEMPASRARWQAALKFVVWWIIFFENFFRETERGENYFLPPPVFLVCSFCNKSHHNYILPRSVIKLAENQMKRDVGEMILAEKCHHFAQKKREKIGNGNRLVKRAPLLFSFPPIIVGVNLSFPFPILHTLFNPKRFFHFK